MVENLLGKKIWNLRLTSENLELQKLISELLAEINPPHLQWLSYWFLNNTSCFCRSCGRSLPLLLNLNKPSLTLTEEAPRDQLLTFQLYGSWPDCLLDAPKIHSVTDLWMNHCWPGAFVWWEAVQPQNNLFRSRNVTLVDAAGRVNPHQSARSGGGWWILYVWPASTMLRFIYFSTNFMMRLLSAAQRNCYWL